MKHKNSHLLVGYWSRLRKGRSVPDQIDVDPRALKRMLPSVFILDAADAGAPFYRLAGTGLCERFGRELKGSDFLSGWDADSAEAVAAALRQSLASGQPVCLSTIATGTDCGMVELETVLTPVSFGPSHRANRFIGLTMVLGDSATLAGRNIVFQRLIATQIVRENEPAASAATSVPPPPPVRQPFGRARVPHLRLVVSREGPSAPPRILNRMVDTLGLHLVPSQS